MVEAREMLSHFSRALQATLPELEYGAPEEMEYIPAVLDRIEWLKRGVELVGYFELGEMLSSFEFKLPAKKRGVDLTDLQLLVRDIKEELVKAIKRIGGYFDFSRDAWERLFVGIRPLVRTLCDFMARFDELYMAEKRARGVFGFNDIERFVYKCLYDEGGEPSDVARALRDELFAVYIDEYQDVNSLQDKIFRAISREDNRFMVGDIKQSIYSFRAAEPDIFARMKATLPTYKKGLSSPAASIFMSSNFRSDKGIIDFANGVFDKIFTHTGQSIGYREEDKLIFGKGDIDGVALGNHTPKITVLSSSSDEDEDKSALLPREVARRIRELLDGGTLADGRPVRPRDIAIILRDMKGRAGEYSKAISALGIPVRVADEKSFFLNREVLLVLCLLNSIDNPRRDVYFAGLLRSPIFDFTADELYLVSKGGGDCLYGSLAQYVKDNPDFKKGAAVLSLIDRYRLLAEGERADRIIRMLYLELGLFALAARGGGKDNLTSYKGLHSFISFINSVIRDGGEFSSVKESSERDEVSIVSVHASKGLEYPIVFYSDTNKHIQKNGGFDSSRLKYVTDFGISFCLRTPSGIGIVESPCDVALSRFKLRRRFEEEMRVLYVCLTRARERLYVLGAVNGDVEEYLEKIKAERDSISAYSLRKKQSYLDILLAADPPADIEVCGAPEDGVEFALEASPESKGESIAPPVASVTRELVEERIKYAYPGEELTRLPEKLSVSVLYPSVLDGADEGASISTEGGVTFEPHGIVPSFISGVDRDESKKRGIATHLFMQFCDVKSVMERGAAAELERLFAEGFISAEDKARVRIEEIERFATSELAVAMASAKRVYRELRFNIKLPAEQFTQKDERRAAIKDRDVLVQGVIDCVILGADGEYRLVDYKTDRLSEKELSDARLAEEKLRAAHTEQLYYYSIAVAKMFGKAPRLTEVYSLPLGRTVEIKTNSYEVKKWTV